MADIEQMTRTLKLGGLAKDWREVEYHDTEQYVTDRSAADRTSRA